MNLTDKQNVNSIIVIVVTAIATALVSSLLVSLNTNQEINVRNIEEIRPILSRLETLELEKQQIRQFYLELNGKISENQAAIRAIQENQVFLRDRYSLFEERTYDFLLEQKKAK